VDNPLDTPPPTGRLTVTPCCHAVLAFPLQAGAIPQEFRSVVCGRSSRSVPAEQLAVDGLARPAVGIGSEMAVGVEHLLGRRHPGADPRELRIPEAARRLGPASARRSDSPACRIDPPTSWMSCGRTLTGCAEEEHARRVVSSCTGGGAVPFTRRPVGVGRCTAPPGAAAADRARQPPPPRPPRRSGRSRPGARRLRR
jgi:hypothetical protein